MRVWYLTGGGELHLEEVEQSPTVGEILHGSEIQRVWPDHSNPFHSWRVLFEAGVLGCTNLEECARQAGLWEPTERVLGYLREMGFEVQHVAGPSPAHQMVFVVRHEGDPEERQSGVGVFPLSALIDYAQLNRLGPEPQAAGTVVPMPALVERADGTLAGPGVAISKRLEEFMAEPHNRMRPSDWALCLLNWAAYQAMVGGCGPEQFTDLAGKTYARVLEDRAAGKR